MTMTPKHAAGAAIIAAGMMAGPAPAAELPTIGGVVFQQDQYFRGIELGLQAGAKDHATLLQGNSESKPEKEATLVDTFVARGAKAIVIAPISAKASVKALRRANDQGVKIVLYGTHMDADFPVAFIGTSDGDIGTGSGKIAAKFIKDKLNGKANLGILAFRSQLAEQSDARTDGFLAAAKDGTTVTVVAQQDGFLAEKAVAVASDLLTAHPEINVIYAANEGGTVGAVQAVRRAGKQGKVFVFGTDGSEQLANFLLDPDGVLIATTAQQPVEVGKDAIETALLAIDGKPVEKQVLVPALPLARDDKAGVEAFLAGAKALQ